MLITELLSGSENKGGPSEKEKTVAHRFVAFVAYEIKSGYLCASVNNNVPNTRKSHVRLEGNIYSAAWIF